MELEADPELPLVLDKEVVVLMNVGTGRDVSGPVGCNIEFEVDLEVLPALGKAVVAVVVWGPETEVLGPV